MLHTHIANILPCSFDLCSAYNKVESEHYKFQDHLKQGRTNLKAELDDVSF